MYLSRLLSWSLLLPLLPAQIPGANVNDGVDDFAAIFTALWFAPDGARIVFASGVYDLHLDATNPATAPYPGNPFYLLGKSNLTLMGNDTVFRLHNFDPGQNMAYPDVFRLEQCDGIRFTKYPGANRSFVVEMSRPPFSQGVLTSAVPPTFNPPAPGRLNVRITDPRHFLAPATTPLIHYIYPYYVAGPRQGTVDHDHQVFFDPDVTPPVYATSVAPPTPTHQDIVIDVPATHWAFAGVAAGAPIVIGHYPGGGRGNFVSAWRSRNIAFDAIDCQLVPGRILAAMYCEDITAFDCSVRPGRNSTDLLSNNSDQFHCQRLKGDLLVDRCKFGRSMDDSISLSMQWAQVEQTSQLSVHHVDVGTWFSMLPAGQLVGTSVTFLTRDLGQQTGQGMIVSASSPQSNGAPGFSLRFSPGTLAQVGIGDICCESDWLPDRVEITNCSFEKNRKSGVFLAVPNVTIRNCSFVHMCAPAVYASRSYIYDPFWANAAGRLNSLIIEDCSIVDCAYSQPFIGYGRGAAIDVHCYSQASGAEAPAGTASNVAVVNCRFKDLDGAGIFISSTASVLVGANLFENIGRNPAWTGSLDYCIQLVQCDPGYVASNTRVGAQVNLLQQVNCQNIHSDW